QGVIAEDIGGGFEGNAGKVEAKFLRHPQVHLVVHQPQGHLGDLGGEFLDLDAVELVYVEVDKAVHIEGLLAAGVGSAQHFEFQQAQLPVGDHQKVATAAGRVEKAQAPQFLVELEQAVLVVLDPVKLIPEGIEKERLDELEDVLLAGVVGAEVATRLFIHDGLEQGAENRRGDAAPVQGAAVEQGLAHGAVEAGGGQGFLEQPAVDVGEGSQLLVEVAQALVRGGVEHVKQRVEAVGQVAAVAAGALLDEFLKLGALEDAGVLGEQAEQQAHQVEFQGVAL